MGRIMSQDMAISRMTKSYARNFEQRLHASCPPLSSWPTALGIPLTEASDLLALELSITMLNRWNLQGHVPSEHFMALQDEMHQGCSGFQQASHGGGYERTVM